MARPRKDKFKEIRIESIEGTELEVVDVSVPSFVKVTYKVKVSEDNNGKPLYGTTDQIVRSLHQTNDEITKIFQEKDMTVIKIEKATMPLPNICEKCHEKGTPRIDKKSNEWDYHAREISPIDEEPKHKVQTNRPDEYWLVYVHKTKPNCRIAQFDKNHFLFIRPKNRKDNLRNHFYPIYLGKGIHSVTLLNRQKKN